MFVSSLERTRHAAKVGCWTPPQEIVGVKQGLIKHRNLMLGPTCTSTLVPTVLPCFVPAFAFSFFEIWGGFVGAELHNNRPNCCRPRCIR